MTPEEFVSVLRDVVLARLLTRRSRLVESPPGRQPQREPVEANAWYQGLSKHDRAQLRQVAAMVAHQAVFGMLAVHDGARAVEDAPEKGEFRLTFRKGSREWELNRPGGVPLHDILNQVPPAEAA